MKANQESETERLPMEFLEAVSDTLRILAHPCRLKIAETLQRQKESPVHEIVAEVGLAQATTSQHLNAMRRAGLIRAERRGREVWYSLADPSAATILDCIRKKRSNHK